MGRLGRGCRSRHRALSVMVGLCGRRVGRCGGVCEVWCHRWGGGRRRERSGGGSDDGGDGVCGRRVRWGSVCGGGVCLCESDVGIVIASGFRSRWAVALWLRNSRGLVLVVILCFGCRLWRALDCGGRELLVLLVLIQGDQTLAVLGSNTEGNKSRRYTGCFAAAQTTANCQRVVKE